VTGIDVKIRLWSGLDSNGANWGAPITVTVFGPGNEAARYMALSIWVNSLDIHQLQGIRGIAIPPELANWPEQFVKACLDYAREKNLAKVRVRRAETLYSYGRPYVNPMLPFEARAKAAAQARAFMERHYDGTAKQLGFSLETNWYVWRNADTVSGCARATSFLSLFRRWRKEYERPMHELQ